MLFRCPACQRTFDEAGFCPFDRAPLSAGATPDARTLVSTMASAAMPAAKPGGSEPLRTEVERRGTFPLTPSPANVRTQDITRSRLPNPPPTPAEAPVVQVRSVSASANPSQALDEAYQGDRVNEYDRLVGQTLDGRYYVEKKIGEGGMGVVFSARHAVIERPLAIKVLKREVMRDTATIRRFVQEAKAASRIGHPNIVDVTDFGTTPDGMTYSVMEYIVGQTLGGAMRHMSPFPMTRAVRVASQIARALGAAHDKGIVHRDLKPENVFLINRDGRTDFVKIVDFGIAKVTPLPGANSNEPRLTRAGSVFGTPEYMAPEQAAGRSDTDGRVDVYALGVILYEMVTGRVPHRGDSMVRTLAMQMLDPVEPPSKVRPDGGIAPELEAVIMKALAKKRDHRYQTMAELLQALEGLQTLVGTSLTGSPVYALAPLPPGADPNTATDLSGVHGAPAAPAVSPPSTTGTAGERGPRARTPTSRRLKDEPEFVTREKPVTFEHVFTDEYAVPRARRWPILLLFALILGGAAGAIVLVVNSRSRVTDPPVREPLAVIADAAVGGSDAAASTEVPGDGGVVVVEVPATPDAGRVALRTRDAGTAVATTVTDGRRIGIQVLTRPEGATLYAGTSYRGRGGVNVEERFGARVELTCNHPGYKPGTVQLVFDGRTEVALCVMTRIKICIPGVKNPFDDCTPADGSAAPSGPADPLTDP